MDAIPSSAREETEARDPPIGTPLGSSWVRLEPRTLDPAYSGVCEEAEVG